MATREVLSFTRPARSQEERTVHRLEVAALCLSAAALLLCLFFGVLGVLAATEEGLEVNLLGLNFGIDPLDFALKLPGFGRVP